jgi:hypothetical protein
MSNKNTTNGNAGKSNELTPAQINENLYQSMIKGDIEPVDRATAFAIMKGAKPTDLEELSGAKYLNFDELTKGDYVYIFKGTTSWQKKDNQTGQMQTVNAVKLEDEEGNELVCAAAVLYSSLKDLQQIPCFVVVTFNGKKKVANGMMYDLAVKTFKKGGDGLPF